MNKLFSLLPLAALFAFGCVSCSDANDDIQNLGEEREVRIVLGGEYIEINHEQMSRADGESDKKTYVGINIYRSTTEYGTYTPYQYGVYDNENDIVVSLKPNYFYKFECTTLTEDHHKLAILPEGFSYPFVVKTTNKYPIGKLNTFVLSDETATDKLVGLGNGTSTVMLQNGTISDLDRPSMWRFYGELEGYKLPDAKSEANISIGLKLASFGVKVVAKDMTVGELTWCEPKNNFNFDGALLTPENTEMTHIFTLYSVKLCWSKPDEQNETFKLKFTWSKNNTDKDIETNLITFSRNVMTIINVSMPTENSLSFEKEESLFEKTETGPGVSFE